MSDELSAILETMAVPVKRRADLGWLKRNLAINNGGHPQLPRALEIIRALLAEDSAPGRNL